MLLNFLAENSNLNIFISEIIFVDGKTSILGEYLGLVIIIGSLLTAFIYNKISLRQLEKTRERNFPLRIWTIILVGSLFYIWSENTPNNHKFNFLWALSLLEPDTIATLWGIPINLWAILSMLVYIPYVVILGLKRKSLNMTTYLSCALVAFILNHNRACGFYLFFSIQSISLLILAKNLIKIPKQGY